MVRSEEVKGLQMVIKSINDDLWKYYNKIYSDESNDIFDEEHDSLYYHIMGWNETVDEFDAEIRQDSDWTTKDAQNWTKALEEDVKFVKELKAYYNAVVKSERPNYLYA